MVAGQKEQRGLPSNGEALDFVCKCFGMPAPDMGRKRYTTLARFRRGEEMSRSNIVEVARCLGNKLARHFCPGIHESKLVERVLAERRFTPDKFLEWPRNSDGTPADLPGYLVLDLIDFMERYDDLAFRVDYDALPRRQVLWALATSFIVPFVATKLAVYARLGLFQGTSWGRAWYLPQFHPDGTVTWPVNHVLALWEDLLAKKLGDLEQLHK